MLLVPKAMLMFLHQSCHCSTISYLPHVLIIILIDSCRLPLIVWLSAEGGVTSSFITPSS